MKTLASILPKYNKLAIRSETDFASLLLQARQLSEEDFNQIMEIPEPYEVNDTTAIIPVRGVVSYNVSNVEKVVFGALDLGEISKWTMEAESSKYENICYHFQSPGGTILQMYETANRISNLGQKKNTIAFTDTMCCSAAQVLAAACNYVYATPSADMASINVVSTRYDISEMLAMEGIKVEAFTGGDLKTTHWESLALTDVQREYMKQSAMQLTDEIKQYMRGKIEGIKDEDMRGQALSGNEMYNKGYITGLVNDFDEFLSLF